MPVIIMGCHRTCPDRMSIVGRACFDRRTSLFDFDWRDPASLLDVGAARPVGAGDRIRRWGLPGSHWPPRLAGHRHDGCRDDGVPLAEFVVLGLLYFVKQVSGPPAIAMGASMGALHRRQPGREASRPDRTGTCRISGRDRSSSIVGVQVTGMARSREGWRSRKASVGSSRAMSSCPRSVRPMHSCLRVPTRRRRIT